MGLNVSIAGASQFENAEILKRSASNLLQKNNSHEDAQKVIDRAFLSTQKQISELYTNQEVSILKASTQITLNNSLKETLKYLKEHASKKVQKTPVLGEIWDEFFSNKNSFENNPYYRELAEFVVDMNAKNIFAA